MKVEALSLAAVFAATSTANAYMYSSGPINCRPPSASKYRNRDAFSSSPRSDRYRQRQQRVEEAFRDMQNEMNASRNRKQQRRRGSFPSGQFGFMMMDPFAVDFQEVDQEAVKKWVDKAFDLASEFNQDFSRSPQEREQNDEFLQKSREWLENSVMYKSNDDPSSVGEENAAASEKNDNAVTTSQMQDKIETPVSITDYEEAAINLDEEDSSASKAEEPEVVTPYSENRSDDEMFQVAVDLPGVDREDVDLTLEQDFLVVQAQRKPREEDVPRTVRNYVKKFAVFEEEIEVDQIEASLNNGVLTVTVPKKKTEEKADTKIKIPLN